MLKNKVRLCEAAMLISLCAALCAGTWAQGRQSELSAQLVRLHVIAASDDEYEQELKLRVRDSVLEYLTPVLDGAHGSPGAYLRKSSGDSGGRGGVGRGARRQGDARPRKLSDAAVRGLRTAGGRI